VNKSHLLAALAAGVAVLASVLWLTPAGSDAVAQQPGGRPLRPASTGPVIALLDVGHIFKNHTRCKAMMDELKAQAREAEQEVEKGQEAITRLRERLDPSSPTAFRKGTLEYKELEQEIAKRNAALAVQIQLQRKEFGRREAKLYHNVYQEILQEVNYYCVAKSVTAVLRFNRKGPDVESLDSVLGYIHKPVVTYAKDLDITDLILQQLNQRAVGSTNPVGVRPRPGVALPR
jgi:Skp family chaperone for outer membrane proteins